LRSGLDKTLPTVTPESALGSALSYLRDYGPRLVRYTERGDLPIDNNGAENATPSFVIGHNARLFSDTMAGANASAVIYSVLETATANGVEPHTWLRRVLRDLAGAKPSMP
jgi:transposase